ncbi:uncharacterized protein F4812DRAFT_225476 [Daldinia caldariorum]|uniref:uncharacterized protein n=1 Tax=Daldinia caldariorum TaxID=326644 RepID=UPI00200863CD|nr:uncharacterized protein F4812DRAFT_225476 [Daldinia caldariorum]KAI1463875.1 hypothetical protein F4812DRAFT_225476 [Daldinia caldariorum]
MAEDPIDISNGTCYYAVDTKARDDYIPCGNVEIGEDWHCCVAGDICLKDSACYHKKFDITYLAGCTDKRYGAPSCPYKGKYSSQQWTGLQRCDGSDDDAKNIWAACKESGDVPGSKPPARCQCSSDTQVLSDKPKLDNVALLPTSLGGTLSWYDGMKPSITETTTIFFPSSTSSGSTLSPTSTGSSANSTTDSSTTSDGPSSTSSSNSPGYIPPLNTGAGGGTPVTVSTDVPNASTNTGTGPRLSTAAQAGIGVGAGVGALLIGCLVYLAFLLRTRRRAKTHGSELIDPASMARHDLPSADNPSSSLASPFLASSNSHGHGHGYGQSGDTTAAFPNHYKSELAAEEPRSAATHLAYSPSAASTPFSPTAASFSSQQKQYTAYNPLLHGNYAEKSEAGQNPVSPMSPELQSGPEGGEPRAAYIHEMEG